LDAIGILVLDDDVASHNALQQMLDSEGWNVRVITNLDHVLPELAKGEARLIITNVAKTGLSGPVFEILCDLALAPVEEGSHATARVLFLVPSAAAAEAQPELERLGLPFLLKPFHLHDFLERVSDLLMETGALKRPMRQVQREQRSDPRPLGPRTSRLDNKRNTMFASREDYMMTEEEMADFERQETEEREKKKKKNPETGF
jgi:DNA-binding NtrC family response regulator